MAEVLFYHLTTTPLERSLPEILEKALARGWRTVVRCGSEAGMTALDAALWTWRDEAFLPHGTSAAAHPERQPIYLTLGDDCPNGAALLVLADGALARPSEMASFARTCIFFDGGDTRALERPARTGAGCGPPAFRPATGPRNRDAGSRNPPDDGKPQGMLGKHGGVISTPFRGVAWNRPFDRPMRLH